MKTITFSSVTIGTATGTLTSNNTNVSDGDTVTIGTQVYRFKNTIAAINDVHIGADADGSLLNLIRAINGSGTPGTDYFTGTAVNASVSAATSVTSHAFLVTAKTRGLDGNSVATTETAATLSWGAATLAGGDTISASGTVADTTFTQPSQQVTIAQYPSGNANWSRAMRLSDAAFFSLRAGANSVAMNIASWGTLAVNIEPGQSWPPLITAQPTAQSCVHSSTTATFTVTATSELTLSYQWQESSDGVTYANVADGGIYAGTTTASLVLTPTTTGQTGYYYRCVLTSLSGTTTSSGAVLTVT